MMRTPYSPTPGAHRSAEVGGRLMIDVWGKYSTAAAGTKAHFIIGGCDEYSDYGFAKVSVAHTTEDITMFIEDVQGQVKMAGHKDGVKIVRHDNAPEMINDDFKKQLTRLEIVDEHTIDYEKEGNGKAERSWGIMLPIARAMLIRCGGNASLFLHAMAYARQVKNQQAQRGAKQSRYHIFHGVPGDVSKFRIFGSKGWARLDPTVRGDKGSPASVECVMIGTEKIGWKVLIGEGATAKIKQVTQAKFYEDNLLTKGVMSNMVTINAATQTENGNVMIPVAANPNPPPPLNKEQEKDSEPTAAQARPRRKGHDLRHTTFMILEEADALQYMETWHPNNSNMSLIISKYLPETQNITFEYTLVTETTRGQAKGEIVTLQGPQGEYTRICPKNTVEAEKTAEAASWRALEVNHIGAMEMGGTVIECHRKEAGGNVVHRAKIDYKIKKNPDTGTWEKDKVRGCADTSHTWDSNEPVYADTINHEEMCLILASAAKHDHQTLKVDIKDAHPNTELPICHYSTMFRKHERFQDDGTQSIYKVQKGLPGLPTAARAFWKKLAAVLKTMGFEKCPSSHAVYRMPGKAAHEGNRIIAGTIVDDIIMTGPKDMLDAALLGISKAFNGDITHEYNPTAFGGYQIRRDFTTKSITIAVPEKIYQLASLLGVKHNPAKDNKFGPPAISKEDLDAIDFDRSNEKLDAEQKLCQKATGLLTWITNVRYDAVYFARKCSRVMSAPKATEVLKTLRAIAQMLIESPHMGKTFTHAPGTMELEVVKSKQDRIFNPEMQHPADLEMVHDATFAVETNKSVGSAAYMFMGAAVKVDIVNIPGAPLSSTESEKYMESIAMARGMGLSNLMSEIDMPQGKPIRMWGDNRISVELAHEARSGKNSTHFARRINYTQEMCAGDEDSPPEYLPAHIPTEKNTVDYLGKLVNATKYRMSVSYNMGLSMEVPPSEDNKKRAVAVYQAAIKDN